MSLLLASGLVEDVRLDQIISILTGRKVYDQTAKTWHVYDENDVELVDASGILLQGLHGFLLRGGQYQAPMFASLGGARPHDVQRKKQIVDEVPSPLPQETVSRIRDELLAVTLTDDVIQRARKRKTQEEEAFLLMI